MNSSQFWDLFEAYKQVHNGVEEVSESSEEMAMLRRNMQDALRRGDGEAIKRISSQLADLQPQAQAGISSQLTDLQPQAQAGIGAIQRGLDKVKAGRPRTQGESYEQNEVEKGYVDAFKTNMNHYQPGHQRNLSQAMRMMKKSDELQTNEPGSKRQKAQTRRSNQMNRLFGSARRANESYDLYDLVLEYLLDKGLCESVENAEIMMAHMSESWVDSIVEEYEEIEEDADTIAHYNQLIKTTKDPVERKKFMTILTRIKQQPNNQMR